MCHHYKQTFVIAQLSDVITNLFLECLNYLYKRTKIQWLFYVQTTDHNKLQNICNHDLLRFL